MAITIVGVGVADSVTPWAPTVAGTVNAGDIILILVEQLGNGPAVAATGYAHVTNSPVNVDTTTQLNVLWKRAVGGETSATVTGPTDHAMTRTITFRGVKATGNPWNGTPAIATDTAVNATATWPSFTPSVTDCCICLCIATGRDLNNTANLGAVTNANLTSLTEQMDNWTNAGGGGGVGLVTGFRAPASATGTSTATMGSTDAKALMTLALEPAPAPAIPPPPFLSSRKTY